MKKIVEFDTAIGTSNLGDEIILQSLREQLYFLYKESFVMRFGTHVKNLALRRYFLGSQKLEFCYEADYKIIMGTNMLSRNIKKTQAQWPIGNMDSWIYKNAILAGVGTTLSEGKVTAHSKKIYNRILRKNFYHSVRDEESKALLEGMGFKAINTGCPTLWKLTPEFCKQIPTKKSSKVIFSLSGYADQADMEADQILLDVLRANYKELIFWCQTSRDEIYLDNFEGVEDIPRVYSLEHYASILDAGDVDYVGTRLHGGVFALQHKVRSIVISIDHRARGFHETNNLIICERAEVENRLGMMINSEFKTEIVIRQDAIDKWKAQFFEEHNDKDEETHDKYIIVKITKLLRKLAKKSKKKLKRIKRKIKNTLLSEKLKRSLKKIYFSSLYSKKMKKMPVKKGKILFFTFQGDYTCNPKYISEEIVRQKLPWKQVWVTLKSPDEVRGTFPKNVKVVKFNTKEYYNALATSEIWVDNAFNFVKGFVDKKPGQIYVQTMHGSLGIKKIGPDVVDNEARNRRGRLCGKLTDICISNSSFEDMVYRTSFWDEKNIVTLGHARNDVFFADEKFNSAILKKVYGYFGLDPKDSDIKLALYAPTFRLEEEASDYTPLELSNLKEALDKKFGGKWFILWRAHHTGSLAPDGLYNEYVLDANNYPDIQELMIAIDFGITDYSSWIFDYVLTRKRGILYTPDIKNYDMNRGFYYPITEAPFPLAVTNQDVKKEILAFDDVKFQKSIDRFLKDRGCIDDGHAAQKIVDYIKDKIN